MNLECIIETKVVANFIAGRIIQQLEAGKKVLWLVPGGSAEAVAAEASKIISGHPHKSLTVTLTDERYGQIGHAESNWAQLAEKGFLLPEATLIPVLRGISLEETTENFNSELGGALEWADYKIGFFGVGADGHTAGMLPGSSAVKSTDLVYSYDAGSFTRVTVTPEAIVQLDEAVVYAAGDNKWPAIKDLMESDIDIDIQPAQILKKIPLLTIFSDYKII
jgi:6-phosphogluconolactonase/glucosamine-6-phosphate isomerase/deaminase